MRISLDESWNYFAHEYSGVNGGGVPAQPSDPPKGISSSSPPVIEGTALKSSSDTGQRDGLGTDT
jgi:hypothetical protein